MVWYQASSEPEPTTTDAPSSTKEGTADMGEPTSDHNSESKKIVIGPLAWKGRKFNYKKLQAPY